MSPTKKPPVGVACSALQSRRESAPYGATPIDNLAAIVGTPAEVNAMMMSQSYAILYAIATHLYNTPFIK